jgi:hypothetical protein
MGTFSSRVNRGAVALVALCLVLSGCTSGSGTALPDCAIAPASEIVPEAGVLFGVNLDFGAESLSDHATDLGIRPTVAVIFADIPLTQDDRNNVLEATEQVRRNGGTLLLTLEPAAGLAAVTDDVIDDIAGLAASVNATGVPAIVRFAHEMNGTWYAWGQQPTAYVDVFRRVAAAVHRDAPGTSMMWAPNYAGGYPFVGGAYAAVPGSADFALLDTDADGVLSAADDSYAPYYPGDDAVDWAGMSLYHWGAAHPWGENEMPEDGKFAAQLTGTYVGAGGDDSLAPDFYQIYGVDHGKPIAIPESAALVIHRGDDVAERAIKQAWWRQVFASDTLVRFPQVKMINWFEWNKFEPEVGDQVDWTVAADSTTRSLFRADLENVDLARMQASRCQPVP